MGGLPSARKNRFSAQGLVPGIALRLEVSVANHTESYATSVEEVDEEAIAVLVPMVQLRTRRLPVGAVVRAEYVFRDRYCRFLSEVMGHSPDGVSEYLSAPAVIDTIERREHFRLQTALKPSSIYRLLVDPQAEPREEASLGECTVTDLSETGLCLSSRARLAPGERLGIQFELPRIGEIQARFRVVSVDAPRRGHLNRRVHGRFIDIRLADRDRIARFLMRRQLEMRRRGQL